MGKAPLSRPQVGQDRRTWIATSLAKNSVTKCSAMRKIPAEAGCTSLGGGHAQEALRVTRIHLE
jgi:hypothetical protein